MRIHNKFLATVLVAAIAGFTSQAAATQITLGAYTPAFVGIDLATDTLNNGTSVAYVARVDLTAPGIGITTTPHSGPLSTIAETTSQFLLSSGTQLAINANFFAPCCNATAEPKTVLGLAVSNGTVVAPASVYPAAGAAVLTFTNTNQASIATVTAAGQIDLTNVYNAVSGSGEIVTHCVNTAATNPPGVGDPNGINPRTDVGLSSDGRYLYLVTIDGRQAGYSAGVTDSDAANLLIALGAYDGINLDGGGSTTMVMSNGSGGATVINRPSGGAQRYDGNALGIYAQPLPEPASVAVLGIGLAMLLAGRRRRAA